MNEIIHRSWLEFLGCESDPFPRHVAPYTGAKTYYSKREERPIKLKPGFMRQDVFDEEAYCSALDASQQVGVCTSLLGAESRLNRTRTRLFVEIGDNSTIQDAHRQMQALSLTLEKLYSATPSILYSANKSFHIHIGISELNIATRYHYIMREVIRHIVNEGTQAGIITSPLDIDIALTDDWNRVTRLPYTGHIKSTLHNASRVVVPINPHWTLSCIMQESKHCEFKEEFTLYNGENNEIRDLIKNTDSALYNVEQTIKDTRALPLYNARKGLKELHYIMQKAPQIKDGHNRILFRILIPHLQWAGYEENEAREQVQHFIEASGNRFEEFEASFDYFWRRTSEDGKPFAPMRIENFVQEYPDLKRWII